MPWRQKVKEFFGASLLFLGSPLCLSLLCQYPRTFVLFGRTFAGLIRWRSLLPVTEVAGNSFSLLQVSLRDLRSFKVEHEFDAFSGSLSDFDVHGNLLAACGFSSRLTGLACDRFLKVYDLRMMRAITPLQVHVDPAFLRFIPTYTSRLAIISQSGMKGVALGRAGERTRPPEVISICLFAGDRNNHVPGSQVFTWVHPCKFNPCLGNKTN